MPSFFHKYFSEVASIVIQLAYDNMLQLNHIVTKFNSKNTYQNQLYTFQRKDYESLFAQVYYSGRFQLLHLSFCAELPLFDLWFDGSPIVHHC